eukprot:COSAG04_NODE_6740_length_1265_cov_1.557461_1_plen_42_part_10
MDAADEGSGGYVMHGYPLGVRTALISPSPQCRVEAAIRKRLA